MNKKYEVTDEQFKKITDKYERLMYTIAYRIGGDGVVHSFDDSVQDLKISALDACEAYGRKMKMSFDEFWGTSEFDKYIKSTMWNKKNSTGSDIQRKWNVHNPCSIEDDIFEANTSPVFEYPDLSAVLVDFALDDKEIAVVGGIMDDFKMIKPNGSINLSRLSRDLGMEKRDVKKIISGLKHLLKDYANFEDGGGELPRSSRTKHLGIPE